MTTPVELARILLETMPMLGQAIGRTMRSNACGPAASDLNTLIHMRMLHTLQDGPKTFQELLAFRGVAPATLSRSLDAMSRHGWIERIPHPEDKRQILLQATHSGRAYFQEVIGAALQQLQESMQQLNDEERDTIALALRLLQRTLK
jgi:DNA-binding MarR family transcriptional regulator